MQNPLFLSLQEARTTALTQKLHNRNELTLRYGLSLSDVQIHSLITAQSATLRETGRIEFGEGILPRLIYTFCDSPYIDQNNYFDTLLALQDLFYTYQNELGDALSDDELLDAMQHLYNGKAQGSLEYLENVTNSELAHAAFPEKYGEEDDD